MVLAVFSSGCGRLGSFLIIAAMFLAMSGCDRRQANPSDYIRPENPLETALVLSALGRAEPGGRTEDVLMDARVYLVVPKDALTEQGQIRDPSKVTYLTVRVKGIEAMALYSSERRLVERFGTAPYIYMPGEEALKLANGLPVTINYGLVPSAFIKAEDVRKLLQKRRGRTNVEGALNKQI